MRKFKIEKKIPVPEQRGRKAIYPFEQMKVGDSFISHKLAETNEKDRTNQSSASNAARNWARSSPRCKKWKFRTAKTPKGIRIWRIK